MKASWRNFTVELVRCHREGTEVILDFKATNNDELSRNFGLCRWETRLFDAEGDAFTRTEAFFAGESAGMGTVASGSLPSGIPVKCAIKFFDIPPSVKSIKILELQVMNDQPTGILNFRGRRDSRVILASSPRRETDEYRLSRRSDGVREGIVERRIVIEVLAGSADDCVAAAKCGADRVELNSSLGVGGLTPSPGSVAVGAERSGLPIAAMLRPRPAGFSYSELEFETMLRDGRELVAAGARGPGLRHPPARRPNRRHALRETNGRSPRLRRMGFPPRLRPRARPGGGPR